MSSLPSDLFLKQDHYNHSITVYLFDILNFSPFVVEHPRYAKKYILSVTDLSVHHTPLFERPLILMSEHDRALLPDFYKQTGWSRLLKAHYFLFKSDDLPEEFPAAEKVSKKQNLQKSLRILNKVNPALSHQKPTCFSSLFSLYDQWTTPADELKMKSEVTALSLSFLGFLYDFGVGTELSIDKAVVFHAESNKQKLPISQLFLAHHYFHNQLIDTSIPLYEEAARAGYLNAQSRLGYIFSIYKNAEEAFKWCRLASDQNDRIGQNNLAYLYHVGLGVELNTSMSRALYKLSAKQGYTSAQCNLAHIYISENNKKKALKYYQMAAESRGLEGYINMGYCYQYGIGTDIDMTKAVSFYQMGVDYQDERCMNNLAFCYQQGRGIEQNYAEAARLYIRAIASDFPAAYYNFAHMLLDGIGIQMDTKRALDYFKIAADKGYSPAQYRLAILYYYGKVTPQNLIEAIRYFKMHYQHSVSDHFDQLSIHDLKNFSYSRKDFLNRTKNIPRDKLSLYLQAHLYLIKGPFLPITQHNNPNNMDIQKIKEIYNLLYDDMDRAWDLLPETTLRDFVYHLSGLIERIVNFNPNNVASSEKEIAESYLQDLKLPAKKSLRHRQVPTKKQKEPIQEAKATITKAPQRVEIIPPTIQSTHQPSPLKTQAPQKRKPKSDTKQKIQRPDSFDSYKSNIQRVLSDLKKREDDMKDFYLKNCDSQIKKLMKALFDKDDMTLSEVNRLIEHLAATYEGEARQGSRTGGMLILKIGDLTTGGHAPHGGKTTVDKGALSDLRQLLTTHYNKTILNK